MLKRFAAAAHHAGQGIVCHHHRQAGFFLQQAIQVAQHAPPPVRAMPLSVMSAPSSGGVCSSAILTARDDLVERIGKRFEDLVGARPLKLRSTPSARLRPLTSIPRTSGTGNARPISFLIQFGGGLADQHAVVAADLDDVMPQSNLSPPTRTEGLNTMPPSEMTATSVVAPADVDHHGAAGVRGRQAGADSRSHGLFDQVDVGGAGASIRLADGAPLDLGRAALGYQTMMRGLGASILRGCTMRMELLEHLLGDGEVGDHAILHGADGFRCCRERGQHLLGLVADSLDDFSLPLGPPSWRMATTEVHQHDALAADVDQRMAVPRSIAISLEK